MDLSGGGEFNMKEILYTTAIDRYGALVRIENAIKNDQYFCPICKKVLIYRNSGKTGKGSRRPHFSHNELSPNCTAESVLHFSFKRFLAEYLENKIIAKEKLIMSWCCNKEKHQNNVDLIEKTALLKVEYDLKVCRPDIALFDIDNNLLAVIEVVVKHFPDETVLKYYQDNDITLIQILLSSEEDLNNIEYKIMNPNFVDYCINPKCISYKTTLTTRRLIIYRSNCDSLYHHQLLKCFVEIHSIFGKQKTLSLTEEEVKQSKANDVDVEEVKNIENNQKTVKFPCRRCAFEHNKFHRNSRL